MAYITGVSVFCPAGHRQLYADTSQALVETAQMLSYEGIPMAFQWTTCADVVDIRNFALTRWYDTEQRASHLIMVDADMRWEAKMIWDMLQFDQPLTGVMYCKRQFPPAAVGTALTGLETTDHVVDGHLEVEAVGGGVLIIKREVVDRMLAAYPQLVDDTEFHQVIDPLRSIGVKRLLRLFDKQNFPKGHPFAPNGGNLSEDLSFCYRWRELGGQVWANVRYPVSHVGPHAFTIRYEEFLEHQKQRVLKGETLEPIARAPSHPIEVKTPMEEVA